MRLKTKTTLYTVFLGLAMVVLLLSISLVAFRQFSLAAAQEHVHTAAEIVRVSLTEQMINGVIDKREQFLQRLSEVEGLENVHVVRGPQVVKQFGAGLSTEQHADAIDNQVLASGQYFYELKDEGVRPFFRGTIPFIADSRGTPNCLQCHEVANGTVLGAVTIILSMEHVKRKALITVSFMAGMVAFFSVLLLFLFRRFITPIINTAQGVQSVVANAKDGQFQGRIDHDSADEVGQIAHDLNTLMSYLQESLGNISNKVARLMRYDLPANTNLLYTTTEMVEALVEVAQFKQAIEEDQTKYEVHARIARVLIERFQLSRFSIYEVDPGHNTMTTVVVNGAMGGECLWCDAQILSRADACRAQRTGHSIDSVQTPHICSQFHPHPQMVSDGAAADGVLFCHICVPVIHAGAVGSVVQLVMPEPAGRALQMMLPFIMVYLRESAPVIEAKRLMDTLRESALRDAMTGLHNRRFLEEYVDSFLAGVRRKGQKVTVLMMDLDHFKSVNDTYGHEVGDTVLKSLAKTLGHAVRSSDLVVRYGGEEFTVVLMDAEERGGLAVAEKIRAAVEDMRISIPGGTLRKTISIGAARYPDDSNDFWVVTKYADIALYQAKTSGRNQVVEYRPEMGASVDKR